MRSLGKAGYNLVWGDTTCPGTNADPKLLALAENGGPTRTFALDDGGAALEQIPSSANGCGTLYTTDQRGYARPGTRNDKVEKKCEIGAWEAQAADPTAITLHRFSARTNAMFPVGWGIGLALAIGVALMFVGGRRPLASAERYRSA